LVLIKEFNLKSQAIYLRSLTPLKKPQNRAYEGEGFVAKYNKRKIKCRIAPIISESIYKKKALQPLDEIAKPLDNKNKTKWVEKLELSSIFL